MTFIENWLGLSPDGGNGSLEGQILAFLLACCLFAMAVRAVGRMRNARPR